MQEAQASCGGGSDSPDTLPIPPQFFFPCHPFISLELYNRFIQNQNDKMDPASICAVEHFNAMDIDISSDDASSGIPPTKEVAIPSPISLLSSRPPVVVATVRKSRCLKRILANANLRTCPHLLLQPRNHSLPHLSNRILVISSPIPIESIKSQFRRRRLRQLQPRSSLLPLQ